MSGRYGYAITVLLAVLGCLVLAAPTLAAAPWKWQRSLIGEPPSNIMQRPMALYVDQEKERYYVVDSGNNRLASFGRDGKFLSAFNADGELNAPVDFVRDRQGRLWVIEKGRSSLTLIDLKARKTKTHKLFDGKSMVLPDRCEYVGDLFYVLDRASGRILSFNQNLQVVKRYECPSGFVDFIVHRGTIWGLSLTEKAVYGYNVTGQQKAVIKLDAGKVGFPWSLAFDEAGYLYVLDRHQGAVAVFDQKGAFKYSFLSVGHLRESLFYPAEIRFDPWGQLCVVDEGNGRVEIFSR